MKRSSSAAYSAQEWHRGPRPLEQGDFATDNANVAERGEEQPSVELVHNVAANPEEQLELARRRAAIEKQREMHSWQRYWLQHTEEIRRERVEGKRKYDQEHYGAKNGQPEGSIGKKVAASEVERDEAKKKQQKLLAKHTRYIQRSEKAVEHATAGGGSISSRLRRTFDKIRLSLGRVDDPEAIIALRTYIEEALPKEYKEYFFDTDIQQLTLDQFLASKKPKHLVETGKTTIEELTELYRSCKTSGRYYTVSQSITIEEPRKLDTRHEKPLADFLREVPNALHSTHVLCGLGVAVSAHTFMGETEGPRIEKTKALLRCVEGIEEPLLELGQRIPWTHHEDSYGVTDTYGPIVAALSKPEVRAALQDDTQREALIAYIEQVGGQPDITHIAAFVAAASDPRYDRSIQYFRRYDRSGLSTETYIDGLYKLDYADGIAELEKLMYAGFGYSVYFDQNIRDLIRVNDEAGIAQKAEDIVNSSLRRGLGHIIDDERLLEFAHQMHQLGIQTIRHDTKALEELRGNEQSATAVAVAAAAFNPYKALIQDVEDIQKILENEAELERVLDPSYAHFVRRLQAVAGIKVEVNMESTIRARGEGMPLLRKWYEDDRYKGIIDDQRFLDVCSAVAESGSFITIYDFESLKKVHAWMQLPQAAEMSNQLGVIAKRGNIVQYIDGIVNKVEADSLYATQKEQEKAARNQSIFLHPEFPRFAREFFDSDGYSSWGLQPEQVTRALEWVSSPDDVEKLLADEEVIRTVRHLLRTAAGLSARVLPNADACTRLRSEDIRSVEAYLADSHNHSWIDIEQLIAFAREQEAIQKGREAWTAIHGEEHPSRDYIALAELGKTEVDLSSLPYVEMLLRHNSDIRAVHAAGLLRHPQQAEELLRLCAECGVAEKALETRGDKKYRHAVHLSTGSLEALVELAPHVDVMEQIFQMAKDANILVYGEVQLAGIAAETVQRIGQADATTWQEAKSFFNGNSLNFHDFVNRLDAFMRAQQLSPEARAMFMKEFTSVHTIPNTPYMADTVVREDIGELLALRKQISDLGISEWDFVTLRRVHEKSYAPVIEKALLVDGFSPRMSLQAFVEFIEGGGIEIAAQLKIALGVPVGETQRASLSALKKFLGSVDAMKAAQVYISAYPDTTDRADLFANAVKTWEDAGQRIPVLQTAIELYAYSDRPFAINDFYAIASFLEKDDLYVTEGAVSAKAFIAQMRDTGRYSFSAADTENIHLFMQDQTAQQGIMQLASMMLPDQQFSFSETAKTGEQAFITNARKALLQRFRSDEPFVLEEGQRIENPYIQKALIATFEQQLAEGYESSLQIVKKMIDAGVIQEQLSAERFHDRMQRYISERNIVLAEQLLQMFPAIFEGAVYANLRFPLSSLETTSRSVALQPIATQDKWHEHVPALLGVQLRAARQDHDPWISALDPLVAALVSKNVVDRSKPEDGALVVEFIRRFGMNKTPQLASVYIELSRAGTLDKMPGAYAEQIVAVLGSKAERMTADQIVNELARFQNTVRTDLLADTVPGGLDTQLGAEIFESLRGQSNWDRGHAVGDLAAKVLKSKAAALIENTHQVLTRASAEEISEEQRRYIRARLAILLGQTAGTSLDLGSLHKAYYALEREWNNARSIFDAYKTVQDGMNLKPGYQETVLRVPELVEVVAISAEVQAAEEAEKTAKVDRLLARYIEVEKEGEVEKHITALGAVLQKLEAASAECTDAGDKRVWWKIAIDNLESDIRVDESDIAARVGEKRIELEAKGMPAAGIERALQGMKKGMQKQVEKTAAFIDALRQLEPFAADSINEEVIISAMDTIANSGIKSKTVDQLLMQLSMMHMRLNNEERVAALHGTLAQGAEAYRVSEPGPEATPELLKVLRDFYVDFLHEHYLHEEQNTEHTGHIPFPETLVNALRSVWHATGDIQKKNDIVRTHKEVDALLSPDTEMSDKLKEIAMVPVAGLMRVYTGDVGNACYTSQHVMLAEGKVPGLTGVIFVTNRGTAQEQFAGSVLFIETTTPNGERVLHIRANNPKENVIRQLDANALVDQVIDEAIAIAQRRGIDIVTLPLDSASQSSSNRPAISDSYKSKFKSAEKIELTNEPETNFNGYKNWDPKGSHPTVVVWTRAGGRVDRQQNAS